MAWPFSILKEALDLSLFKENIKENRELIAFVSRVNRVIWRHQNRPHCSLLFSPIVYGLYCPYCSQTVPIVLKPSLL